MSPYEKHEAENFVESSVTSKETQVKLPLDFSNLPNENLFSEMNSSIQPPLSDYTREKKRNVFMFRENP